MRNPADIVFGRHELQPWEALEYAVVQKVDERILYLVDNRHRGGDPALTKLDILLASEDVETQGQSQVLRRGPEGIEVRVAVRHVPGRSSVDHHPTQSLFGHTLEFAHRLIDLLHGDEA